MSVFDRLVESMKKENDYSGWVHSVYVVNEEKSRVTTGVRNRDKDKAYSLVHVLVFCLGGMVRTKCMDKRQVIKTKMGYSVVVERVWKDRSEWG